MAVEPVCKLSEDWYALFVKTGAERSVQGKLKCLGLQAMSFHVPCRELRVRSGGRWATEITPLFPGYVLARGRLTDHGYARAGGMDGVYRWISDEHGPLRVLPEEVDMIQSLMDECDIVRVSRAIRVGQGVRVVDGPLTGREAIIRKLDARKGRAKIAISVFGEERLVDISVEDVEEGDR